MAGLEVQIRSTAAKASERIRRLRLQQLPFSTAAALTKSAPPVTRALGLSIGQTFKQRSRGLSRAWTFDRALKSDWPTPRATLYLRRWAEFMADHATGGIRKAERGASRMAVPTSLVRRTSTGRVRKADKPRRLREKEGTVVRREGASTVIQIKRKDREKTRASIFYTLHSRVRIRKVWAVRDVAAREFGRVYPATFRAELERNVARAR